MCDEVSVVEFECQKYHKSFYTSLTIICDFFIIVLEIKRMPANAGHRMAVDRHAGLCSFQAKEEEMAEYNNIKVEVEGKTATLSICRPKALNALNSETIEELDAALTEIEANDDIRVLILTGGPCFNKKLGGDDPYRSFVAGADIKEMQAFDAPAARAFGMKASVPFFKLMNMRQVTIAAVNGFALGGGCEISMACDIRVASENAVFGQPECGLGIIPGFGGTQRLARLVGMGRAKEMIFTCDNIDAQEAYRIGLVNKVVPKEELYPTVKKMAEKIESNASFAISVAKQAINNGYDMDIKNGVELEANLFGVCNDTHDKKEGMGAFVEGRKEKNFTDF